MNLNSFSKWKNAVSRANYVYINIVALYGLVVGLNLYGRQTLPNNASSMSFSICSFHPSHTYSHIDTFHTHTHTRTRIHLWHIYSYHADDFIVLLLSVNISSHIDKMQISCRFDKNMKCKPTVLRPAIRHQNVPAAFSSRNSIDFDQFHTQYTRKLIIRMYC